MTSPCTNTTIGAPRSPEEAGMVWTWNRTPRVVTSANVFSWWCCRKELSEQWGEPRLGADVQVVAAPEQVLAGAGQRAGDQLRSGPERRPRTGDRQDGQPGEAAELGLGDRRLGGEVVEYGGLFQEHPGAPGASGGDPDQIDRPVGGGGERRLP